MTAESGRQVTCTPDMTFPCLRDITPATIPGPSTLKFGICLATATLAVQCLVSLLKAVRALQPWRRKHPAALNSKPASAGARRLGQMTSGEMRWYLF